MPRAKKTKVIATRSSQEKEREYLSLSKREVTTLGKAMADVPAKKTASLPEAVQAHIIPKGQSGNPNGAAPGMRLMTRIKQILGERSLRVDPETQERSPNTRFDDVADAFVRRMEMGEFQHMKEYIEREEGKVSNTLIVTDDTKKLYIDTPTEGPAAP